MSLNPYPLIRDEAFWKNSHKIIAWECLIDVVCMTLIIIALEFRVTDNMLRVRLVLIQFYCD